MAKNIGDSTSRRSRRRGRGRSGPCGQDRVERATDYKCLAVVDINRHSLTHIHRHSVLGLYRIIKHVRLNRVVFLSSQRLYNSIDTLYWHNFNRWSAPSLSMSTALFRRPLAPPAALLLELGHLPLAKVSITGMLSQPPHCVKILLHIAQVCQLE